MNREFLEISAPMCPQCNHIFIDNGYMDSCPECGFHEDPSECTCESCDACQEKE